VYGHQDDHIEYNKHSLESQLSVDADALAEQYYSDTLQSMAEANLLPACPAMLVLRGITVSNQYKRHLVHAYNEPAYIEYIQTKYKWSDPLIQSIAWKSLSCGIWRVQQQCLVIKICNDLLPTAVTLKKMNYQKHDTCCLYGQQETREHLFSCTDQSRIKWKIQYINALRNRLQKIDTKPGVIDVLSSTITNWFDHTTVTTKKYDARYHPAILHQNTI